MKRLKILLSLAVFTLFAAACDDELTPLAPSTDDGPGLVDDSDFESPQPLTIAELVVDQASNPDQNGRVEFTALLDAVLSADPAILDHPVW